jgi:hypothetical protein
MSGDLAKAEEIYLKALHTSTDINSMPVAMDALLGISDLLLRKGDPQKAWKPSTFVLGHSAIVQETKERALQIRQAAEKALGNEQIQAMALIVRDQCLEDILNSCIRI